MPTDEDGTITIGTETVPTRAHPVDRATRGCFCARQFAKFALDAYGMNIFGAKSVKSCLPSTHWTGANHK